jgi:hypothetical protein
MAEINKRFIVRIDEQNTFFTRLHEGAVYGTPFMSYATVFEYDVADTLARRLRNRGYPAWVTDLHGEPVSAASLKTAPQPVSESRFLEYWDDRPTKEDRELVRETITNKDPKDLAVKLGISVSDLEAKMTAALRGFTGNWTQRGFTCGR